MLLPGERSVFAINADSETKLAAQRREFWKMTPKDEALRKVREIIGARRLAELPEPKHHSVGVIQQDGYRIEKIVIEPEPGIQLPALAFVPSSPSGDAYLYLHDQGKQTDAATGGPIEQLLSEGHVVLAVDLRGMGETANRNRKWYGGAFGPASGDFFLAYLLGKSLIGLWTEDALTCGRFLASYETHGAPRKVHLVGIGQAGLPALHAAALEPDFFATLTLRRTLGSWAEVVRAPTAASQLPTVVHGALRFYDLPDLIASLGAGKVTIEKPFNALGETATTSAAPK
jgi:pimeloyl-ACP methyl ester carboxylesterase